jgi:hypothetical protein
MSTTELLLAGLDGSNPLAFLACLGTLRALTGAWPDRHVRISWSSAGAWRPVLHVDGVVAAQDVISALVGELKKMEDHPAWTLGADLNVGPERFREFAEGASEQAQEKRDRTWADFAAAFGCESTTTSDGRSIQDTALRTMSGAGHQHFVQFMSLIVQRTTARHLEKTLFETWRYDDPVEKCTLRWDPQDDVRRALQWRDPSGDPERKKRGNMLGANRLAIEALPLLPTIPDGRELHTTGFSGRGSQSTFWTWPIWSGALSLDVVRSVLAMSELQHVHDPGALQSRGIAAVMRCRRLTIGKFRNFTPAQPL